MAPTRGRVAPEDGRFEIANTKEKPSGSNSMAQKARRNGAATQTASTSNKESGALPVANSFIPNAASAGIHWTAEEISLLHAYRSAYGVEVPSAMKSPLSTAVLTVPGIGRNSPTMARRKEKRKTGKEQLALTLRKHFNGLAVSETDVVVEFLYSVKFQDHFFKMRFAPK